MVSEMLFYFNMKFLNSGYSCHLLTTELISERGYEVKLLLLLFRLGRKGVKQSDGLNAMLFKIEKATVSGMPRGKASRSEITPKLLLLLFCFAFIFFKY
jgi:hypothetical protein